MIKRVYRVCRQCVTPFLYAPFERECEKPIINIIRRYIIPILEVNKCNYVPEQGCSILTIELISGQVIYDARRHFEINNVRETFWGYDLDKSQEICA